MCGHVCVCMHMCMCSFLLKLLKPFLHQNLMLSVQGGGAQRKEVYTFEKKRKKEGSTVRSIVIILVPDG